MSGAVDEDFIDERLRVLAYLQHWIKTARGEHLPWEEVAALRPTTPDETDHCFTAALSINYLLLRHLAHAYGQEPQELLDRLRTGVMSGAIPWTGAR